MPKKTELFKVIAKAEQHERIPRVPGAFHFALPFRADPDVDWVDWFDGNEEPRAVLVSQYTSGPKAGLIYPTDIEEEDDVDAFLGVIIDGVNWERDLNFTVTLAAGIPRIYLQSTPAKPAMVVDSDLTNALLEEMGFKIYSQNVFWNKVQ